MDFFSMRRSWWTTRTMPDRKSGPIPGAGLWYFFDPHAAKKKYTTIIPHSLRIRNIQGIVVGDGLLMQQIVNKVGEGYNLPSAMIGTPEGAMHLACRHPCFPVPPATGPPAPRRPAGAQPLEATNRIQPPPRAGSRAARGIRRIAGRSRGRGGAKAGRPRWQRALCRFEYKYQPGKDPCFVWFCFPCNSRCACGGMTTAETAFPPSNLWW